MLTIRLTRKGKKNQPFFRVVVVDKKRSSKGGRAVEELGYVNPLTKKRSFEKDRILYWISKGAQPSPTVHNLLVTEKIIEAPKKVFKSKKPKVVPAQAAAITTTLTGQATPVAAAPTLAPTPVQTQTPEKPAETEMPKA